MKKAIKLVIEGIVQGVFFRKFVKDNADKFGLKGFVRNLDTGKVEIFIEGDHEDIDKMVEVCKQGSQFSKVDDVRIEEKKYSGDYSDFKVIRF